MSLINPQDMSTLMNAADVKSVALSAIDDAELMKVANAINTAANSGETSILWNGDLRDATVSALKAKQYEIISYSKLSLNKQIKISWGK